MRKRILKYLNFVACIILLNGCSETEMISYSGVQAIQFTNLKDSVKSYMFYYDAPSVESAVVNFEVQTIGFLSDVDRTYKITQLFPDGANNPEAGVHFVEFSEEQFVVKAGEVKANAPIALIRNQLEPKKIYELTFQIESNDHFIEGDPTLLKRKLIFSRDLLKPDSWLHHVESYLGAYSVNKHMWMIEQTSKKWDNEFISEHLYYGTLGVYWRDRLNKVLREYNTTIGPLYDDDGYEIKNFGK